MGDARVGVTRKDRPAYVRKYDAPKVMTSETTRPDIRVGQTVSVYEDRIVFEKREFTSGLLLGEDWTVELPAKSSGFAVRAKAARPAEFPAGAALAVSRTTAKTRGMNKYGEAIEPESKLQRAGY